MEIEDCPLTEEELSEIRELDISGYGDAITAHISADVPKKPVKIIKATDEECEKAVFELLCDFPGLSSSKSSHWTMTMISILNRIDYRPDRGTIANGKSYIGYNPLSFVQHHISPPVLEDIRRKLVEWAADNPSAMTMEGVEGAVIITETGGLAYASEPTHVETTSSSDKQEGWASW